MMNVDLLLYIYVIFIFAIITPGANMIYLVAASVSGGRSAGLAAAVGIAFGSLTWSTVSTIFINQLVNYSEAIGLVVGVLGGMYLLYMGVNQFLSRSANLDESNSMLRAPLGKYMLGGYFVMISNPKAILAWISIVSFISLGTRDGDIVPFVIVGTFAISLVVHSLFSLCFCGIRSRKIYFSNYHIFRIAFSVVFCVLGIYLVIRSTLQWERT